MQAQWDGWLGREREREWPETDRTVEQQLHRNSGLQSDDFPETDF